MYQIRKDNVFTDITLSTEWAPGLLWKKNPKKTGQDELWKYETAYVPQQRTKVVKINATMDKNYNRCKDQTEPEYIWKLMKI